MNHDPQTCRFCTTRRERHHMERRLLRLFPHMDAAALERMALNLVLFSR